MQYNVTSCDLAYILRKRVEMFKCQTHPNPTMKKIVQEIKKTTTFNADKCFENNVCVEFQFGLRFACSRNLTRPLLSPSFACS